MVGSEKIEMNSTVDDMTIDVAPQTQPTLSNGRVVVTGKWLRIASVRDEDWLEGDLVPSPQEFADSIPRYRDMGADLFTFTQKMGDLTPRYPFHREWDNAAAIPTVSYDDWWNNRVSSYLRRDVRKATKLGVDIRPVEFSNELVNGIVDIYDETPILQGIPFAHYKKGFDAVKSSHSTFLERSSFIGAFLGDELIGFLKIVYVDAVARIMQIISKESHQGKCPTNALIAKAVEISVARGCTYLTYGKYHYPQGADSLTAFKHRNGFEEVLLPKYYVPLTAKGKLALALHMQHGPRALVPPALWRSLKRVRAKLYRHPLLAPKAV